MQSTVLMGQWLLGVSSWRTTLTDTMIELRNFIYHYSLDWNRVQGPMDAIKRTIEALPENDKDDVAARRDACIVEHDALLNSRQTPTILLLCKQVTSEAVSILHDIPLTLNFKPRDWVSRDQIFFVTERPYKAKEDKRMPVFKWAMMSRTTIKQVKKATFFIPNWGDGNITGDILQPWFYLLAMSGIFMQDDSSLEELRIEFSGPTGNGIGDLVWILDGRNKELVSLHREEITLFLTIPSSRQCGGSSFAPTFTDSSLNGWIGWPSKATSLPSTHQFNANCLNRLAMSGRLRILRDVD